MITAILQARLSSSRLPGKVLKPILGKPMMALQIERILRSRRIDRLVVATSTEKSDDPIAELCASLDVACFRGSLTDVLDRFYQASRAYPADHLVRLTADCPLIDPQIIDQAIELHLGQGNDYTSNALVPSFPDGLDVEVVKREALETAWREATASAHREHVMPFLHSQPARFKLGVLKSPKDLSRLRWTVDEPADLEVVRAIFEGLYEDQPHFSTEDILRFLENNPTLMTLNSVHARNEGYLMSEKKDALLQRYQASNQMLERALKTIPLGSQTFSKSKTHFPAKVSPHFIARAQGSRAWDVDGNEYVDFMGGLCAINLGYNDPDVTKAVEQQLKEGVIFSLPHPIETKVAEKLAELVPCAEMVRFGKNGSDATAGAVRLARAYTGRDHVAVCGYHGWQDWYIGSTARNRGVPQVVRDQTHAFAYNDIESAARIFKSHPGGIAAVILEPMNVQDPKPGFLEELASLTRKNGALLIFDETITGFRFAKGGAQEYFGITPDLATFGKGMANGYPVSAVVGKAELMRLMEDIFFSFTFGGETLSLAAALATMEKIEREPVIPTLYAQGKKILEGTRDRIARHEIGDFASVSGNPTWSFLNLKDAGGYTSWQLKTLFLQEIFARGILTLGSHNLSYAHSDADVAGLLKAYDEVFPILGRAVRDHALEKLLFTTPLEPLFKVR